LALIHIKPLLLNKAVQNYVLSRFSEFVFLSVFLSFFAEQNPPKREAVQGDDLSTL
jgi:hypothetical protein